MKQIFVLIFCLILPLTIHSQRVQLSGIPGQDSGMNINDMLNQIMEPYHKELSNIQNRKRDKEIEFKLLQDFKTNVDNFDKINRYIFGYESAFRSLTNSNSDPNSVEVQAERLAKKGTYILNIKQLAQKDAFSSPAILLDHQIPAGKFSVKIGTETIGINFNGGNIIDLANILQEQLSNVIDIRVINTSDDSRTIVFEGKKEGIDQKIIFDGDLTPLTDINLLTKGQEELITIPWQENQSNIIVTNKTQILNTKELIKPQTSLSFQVKLQKIEKVSRTNEEKIALSNLSTEAVGQIKYENIILPGSAPILEDFITNLEPTNQKTPEQNIILTFDDKTTETLPLKAQAYSIPLEKYKHKNLVKVIVNSEDIISDISELRLTTRPEGSLRPYSVISEAQNAIIHFDGVKVERPNNQITNLVTGVNFNLLQASQKDITIHIKPDIELIKDTIIQWVLSYNNIMEEIFTFTTIPLEKIGRIKPLHQREKDGDDLKEGSFYGNASLVGYKDRMRRLVGTSFGNNPNKISLLDQIGIYVRRVNSINTDPEAVKKGTLTLDMNQFEQKLNSNFDDVYNLFVQDIDGDRVGDLGVTVSAQEVLKLMTGNAGYLTKIEQDNRRVMKEFNDKIAKKEDEVDRVERRERQSLLQMSQAVAASKAQNEALKQRFGN